MDARIAEEEEVRVVGTWLPLAPDSVEQVLLCCTTEELASLQQADFVCVIPPPEEHRIDTRRALRALAIQIRKVVEMLPDA